MIGEFREEVQAETKQVREDMSDLLTNTTKVLDHISEHMNSIENTLPTAVLTDKGAQLRTDVNFLMERCNALSNEMDLGFSRVAECVALLE